MALMIVILLFGLGLFGIGIRVSICGGKLDNGITGSVGVFFIGLGIIFITVASFIIAPSEIPIGLPMTSINNGEYKAAFVYVVGENVNVGIEKKNGENERLYLYQFPKSAFDSGSMNTQAKKLVVVESDGFRKIVLK